MGCFHCNGTGILEGKRICYHCEKDDGVDVAALQTALQEAERKLELLQPQWSENAPTEPGWYWLKTALFPDSPSIVRITRRGVTLFLHFPGKAANKLVGEYHKKNTCRWCKVTPPQTGDKR